MWGQVKKYERQGTYNITLRRKVASLENNEWKIKFSWVKAHAGNYGNELADRLAKEAARSDSTNYE